MFGVRQVIVAAVAIAGCGESTSGAAFAGTWQFEAGSRKTVVCSRSTYDLAGEVITLEEGTSSDLEMPLAGHLIMSSLSCPVSFQVDGAKANGVENACTVGLVGSGCPVKSGTMTLHPFVLTLTSETTMEVDVQWGGLYGSNGCNATPCSGSIVGTTVQVPASSSAH